MKKKCKRESMPILGNMLFFTVLLAIISVLVVIFSKNAESHDSPKEEKRSYAEVKCEFHNYEVLKDNNMLVFIDEENDIYSSAEVEKDGTGKDLIVQLKPGKYDVLNRIGRVEEKTVLEITDAGENYILDIDCKDGTQKLTRVEDSYVEGYFEQEDEAETEEAADETPVILLISSDLI